jgi:peptidoglycan/LPS O-acetylase OafA/YrhL
MPSAVEISGDVASAASALAGLLLVFLGAVSASFGSYDAAAQNTVRARYQRRAWFAFVGFVLALSAVPCALVAKWLSQQCLALTGLALLIIALIWALLAALLSAMEIR